MGVSQPDMLACIALVQGITSIILFAEDGHKLTTGDWYFTAETLFFIGWAPAMTLVSLFNLFTKYRKAHSLTLCVNVIGCLVLGIYAATNTIRRHVRPEAGVLMTPGAEAAGYICSVTSMFAICTVNEEDD